MRFYVTFGQRYRREDHPVFLNAHPDGFVVVDAPEMEWARASTVQWLGEKWSNIYTRESFRPDDPHTVDMFPFGALAFVHVDGTVSLPDEPEFPPELLVLKRS